MSDDALTLRSIIERMKQKELRFAHHCARRAQEEDQDQERLVLFFRMGIEVGYHAARGDVEDFLNEKLVEAQEATAR